MPGSGRNQADEAFAEFVLSWQRPLERTAYLLCGDHHKAQDVVATVLVRLYPRWSRIQGREGPVPYARRAVANACVDERRRPWRREVAVAQVPDQFAPEHVPDGIDDQVLLRALATLAPGQRAVVVLRYVEDLDVDATAGALGIAPGTVKSQAARGLATLRRYLAQPVLSDEEGPR